MRRKQRRSGASDQPLVEQLHVASVTPVVDAEVNGCIECFGFEIEALHAGGEVDRYPWVTKVEVAKPRRQPSGSESGENGQRQHTSVGIDRDLHAGAVNEVESTPYVPPVCVGSLGRNEPPPLPFEQLATELGFEVLNQPANRTLGQLELPRSS